MCNELGREERGQVGRGKKDRMTKRRQMICSFIPYGVFMSLEAHRDVPDRTQPGAVVTGFLSLPKKDFKRETNAGKQK